MYFILAHHKVHRVVFMVRGPGLRTACGGMIVRPSRVFAGKMEMLAGEQACLTCAAREAVSRLVTDSACQATWMWSGERMGAVEACGHGYTHCCPHGARVGC